MAAKKKLITPKTIVQLLIVIVVIPLMPMIISGVWNWWEAWVYALLHILGFIVSSVLASCRHPIFGRACRIHGNAGRQIMG